MHCRTRKELPEYKISFFCDSRLMANQVLSMVKKQIDNAPKYKGKQYPFKSLCKKIAQIAIVFLQCK